MRRVFTSDTLQQSFEQDGFVQLPFLSEEEVDQLLFAYESIADEHYRIGIPFITTSHSNNSGLIRKANAIITEAVKDKMHQLLNDYALLFGNFLIKQPGEQSVTDPHQDTTFVDETKFSSVSFWVSLEDTNRQNGCMRFVKGSHRFFPTLRPAHAYPWIYESVKPRLESMLTDYPSRKGDVFIFHHGIIHASYANMTTKPRIAALMAAYPREAELWMLFQKPQQPEVLQTYQMSTEAFLHFKKGQVPEQGQLINEQPIHFTPISIQQLEDAAGIRQSIWRQLIYYISNRKAKTS